MRLNSLLHNRYFQYSILLLCFVLIYPLIFDSKLFEGGDNAQYYILGHSLANGQGYVDGSHPLLPAANHFPPGYPFLMSLIMRLGADSIIAMKVLNGILLLLSTIVFYEVVSLLTKRKTFALLLSIVMLLNTTLLEFGTIMMSEISFLLFILLVVYTFLRSKAETFSTKSIWFYLMVLSCIAVLYIRTQGIALVGAILLFLLIKKHFQATVIATLITVISLLPWQIRSSQLGGNSYMKQVTQINPYNKAQGIMTTGDWFTRIGYNAERYVSKEIPYAVVPILKKNYFDATTNQYAVSPVQDWIFGGIIIVLTFLGIWITKELRWFFLFFFGGTLFILLLWPHVWHGTRFILPMIPFILLFISLGLKRLSEIALSKTPNEIKKLGVFGFILAVLVSLIPIYSLSEQSKESYTDQIKGYYALGTWSGENLSADAVIACRKPGLFFTQSKLKTIRYKYTSDAEELFEQFDRYGVTHVVVDQLGYMQTQQYLAPIIQAHPERFTLTHIQRDHILDKDPSGIRGYLFTYNQK